MLLNIQEQENNQEPQVQTPYAIVKLEESARVIKQAISELPTLRGRLEKNMEVKHKAREIYGDMQNQHRRLLGAIDTAALSLLEAEQGEMAEHSVKLGQAIESFNLMTQDYTQLCKVFNDYLSSLPIISPNDAGALNQITADETGASNEAQTTNSRIIGRLMNSVKMGYYPTCTDNLSHVLRGMDFPEGVTVNMIDPCCGCGLALRFLAEGAADNAVDCKTYGIELDSYRANEALARLDRVGFGSYFHSRISNEAFHAMLLNPPYLSVMTEGGNNTRSEKNFLVDSARNLMMGGLLIYIIPHYRLTADIARFLCDNFDDISIWKFTVDEFKKYKQIAVLGTKRKKRDGSDMVSALTSLVLNPGSLPELTELSSGRYRLPNTVKEVALFKGAVFNESELAEQLSNSKSFSRLFQRSGLDNRVIRPLLPFSIGQIGLVGGSGLINGLVECEAPHIIKGRIIKEKRTHTEEKRNRQGALMFTTLIETTSNKLIFNLLTPNGFISLTDYDGGGAFINADNDPSDDTVSRLGHSDFRENTCLPDVAKDFGANSNPIFSLGETVITAGAREALDDYDIQNALRRHETGDWGEVEKADWKSNDSALKQGDRILSTYLSSNDTIFWIITEWDRSVTTVLLPEDY